LVSAWLSLAGGHIPDKRFVVQEKTWKVWMSQPRSPAMLMLRCGCVRLSPCLLLPFWRAVTCNGLLRAGAANQGACRAVPAAAATGTLGGGVYFQAQRVSNFKTSKPSMLSLSVGECPLCDVRKTPQFCSGEVR
jgi:hypothetical protein